MRLFFFFKAFQVMSGRGLQGQLKFYTLAAQEDDMAASELMAQVTFLDLKKRGDRGISSANNSQGCGISPESTSFLSKSIYLTY